MEEMEGGIPSVFACPDCGGVLWDFHDGEMDHYRCRIGHAYSVEGLHASQQAHHEDALWAALRALDENTELTARLAERAARRGLGAAARRFDERARTAAEQAAIVRQAIEDLGRRGGEEESVPEPLRGQVALGREEAGRRDEDAG